MKNNLIIYAPSVLVAGLMLNLSGCSQSNADQTDTTAQSVTIDSTYEDVAIPEVLDNTSDVYFERAVSALRQHNNKRAAIELKSGIAAFEEEAQFSGTRTEGTLVKQLAKMKALVPQIESGNATDYAVQFTTEVGELLVAHDRIEKIETLPVYTAAMNIHMRQMLNQIEKNTVHLGQQARQEGKAVIEDARVAVNNFDNATKNDTQKARQNVRQELSKVKLFIKKYI